MQSNIPKVSEETKKRWNEEVAQKVQRKLERSSRRDDWGERLEAAACEEGLKAAQQLYDGASRAHDIQAEEKPKLKSKHKDKEKSKKRKKRKHKSSEAEEVVRKGSKKSRKSDPADREQEAIRCDDASKAP